MVGSMNNDGLTLNQLAERNAALVTDVEKLRAERYRLAAENMAMIRLLTDISDNHVEYLSEGEGTMLVGVPLDYVSEINMYVSRDVNAENPFPATDRILAAVEARGVEGHRSPGEEVQQYRRADHEFAVAGRLAA